MYRIGVLALQGGVREHMAVLNELPGVQGVLVRRASDLCGIDGLVLPGGESTVMGRLLHRLDLMEALRKAIQEGLPTFGTCAGMILMAKTIENQVENYLKVLDVAVCRNAFGRQLESFDRQDVVEEVSKKAVNMRFVRAPRITGWDREKVAVLYELEGFPVAVRQGHLLALSFHPELVAETCFHAYFVNEMVKGRAGTVFIE